MLQKWPNRGVYQRPVAEMLEDGARVDPRALEGVGSFLDPVPPEPIGGTCTAVAPAAPASRCNTPPK